jgi:Tfp pilus assembly protein PilX
MRQTDKDSGMYITYTQFAALKAKSSQRGAVLVISLLVLMVLTLLGISTLDSSIMEEKMAANTQTASATFQKAESSIREALYIEFKNPAAAVSRARTEDTPVNHDNADISSTSQHRYDPLSQREALSNSSVSIFEARPFQIVGNARSGAIQTTNTQSYRVFPMMREP